MENKAFQGVSRPQRLSAYRSRGPSRRREQEPLSWPHFAYLAREA